MASITNSPSDLYERDYYAWLQDQVRALRERRIEDVDWENVAEEIEDLGKSERRAIESQLARLTEHLLKLKYVHGIFRDYNTSRWQVARSARFAIQKLLKESPNLRPRLAEMLADAYLAGRIEALRDPGLSDDELPASSSWTVEQVMDEGFLSD
jgi:hypothetical protein